MDKNECFFLGHTVKPHGFKGEINIKLDVDNPKDYKEMESVFIEINDQLVPFFIEKIHISDPAKGFANIKLEGIDNIDQAQKITGYSLYLPLFVLPPLKGNKFYFHEIIGFEIIDVTHGSIGEVKEVLDFPQQAILQVMKGEKEILIPITDAIILTIDREQKNIGVNLPEGLLEVYL
jgi:16S rRNA processing protein RimM